jgi:tetratricopeptide (TPR) repeat protein
MWWPPNIVVPVQIFPAEIFRRLAVIAMTVVAMTFVATTFVAAIFLATTFFATTPVSAGFAAVPAQTPAEAIALQQKGDLPRAAQAWRAVTLRHPDDAAAFASLGVVLSKQQKYPEAATVYRKALALDPKLPGVELNLGLAEFKQGHFRSAESPLRRALQADPPNPQAQTLLGMSYYSMGRFAEAEKYLGAAAKSDSGNLELQRVLAQSCLWARDFQCAQEEFHSMLEKNPDSAQAHILFGEALDGLGRTEEAIAEFEAAAKLSPREPNVHFGLGYLHWRAKEYDAARQEFGIELQFDASNAQALAYLGDIAWKNNDPVAALSFFDRAGKVNDRIRIVSLDRGAIYMQQKRYRQARAALLHAVALDPAQTDAHYQLGRLYQAMGKPDEAQKELLTVRQLHKEADDSLAEKLATSPPALNPSETN